MAGDIRLGETGGGNQLRDVLLPLLQSPEDPETTRLREGSKPGGNQDERLVSDRLQRLLASGGHCGK